MPRVSTHWLRRTRPGFVSTSAVRNLFADAAALTAGTRAWPDVLLVGAQKAGTTTLFNGLVASPGVASPVFKEGFGWSFWPLENGERPANFSMPIRRPRRQRNLYLEASTSLLADDLAPARVAARVPDARLIVLLREPAARLRSHYMHNVARGLECNALTQAVEDDLDRIARTRDTAFYHREPYRTRFAHEYGYVRNGLYGRALANWLDHYSGESLAVVFLAELSADQVAVTARVCEWLGVPPSKAAQSSRVFNAGRETGDGVDVPARALAAFDDDRQALGSAITRADLVIGTPWW